MKTKKSKRPDYEKLGKMLESIYESGYVDHAKTYKMSFLKGMIAGFGGVIGATIVVALLLWILSIFSNIEIIKPAVDTLKDTLDQNQR